MILTKAFLLALRTKGLTNAAISRKTGLTKDAITRRIGKSPRKPPASIQGKWFGKLHVTSDTGEKKVTVKCFCGNYFLSPRYQLTRKKNFTKSCGCVRIVRLKSRMTKIPREDIPKILNRLIRGESQRAIGRSYGVTHIPIHNIAKKYLKSQENLRLSYNK